MGTEEMWPYLLASSGVPALLQFVTLLFFPETPRYLYIDKGDTEGSKKGEWTHNILYTSRWIIMSTNTVLDKKVTSL